MKCPKCGGHMEETDKRCPYCNSYNENYKKPKQPTQPQPQPKGNNNTNKKPEEDFGVGCLTVLAIFFVVILLLVLMIFGVGQCVNCISNKKSSTYSKTDENIYIIKPLSDTTNSGPNSRRLEKSPLL